MLHSTEHLIGQAEIAALMQAGERLGYAPRDILVKADLPASIYSDPRATIDGVQLQRLLWTIQAEMNDLFMGFLAQPAKPGLDQVQSKIRFQCQRLGEAIRVSTDTREAVRNDVRYQCVEDKDLKQFTLIVHYQLLPNVDAQLFYWHRLMLIYRYYCWLTGKRIKLAKVNFSGSFEDKLDDHFYSPFNAPVYFGQDCCSLTFDSQYLLCPIVRRESEEADYVKNYPDWFTVPGEDTSWTKQTEQIIKAFQQERQWSPSTLEVAKKLSVSARTLRRKLARENQTYRDIKAQLRCQQAIKLLADTDLPIAEVADQIGFSEPGDFTRAFISWTQSTPSAYRETHRNGPKLFSDLRHFHSF